MKLSAKQKEVILAVRQFNGILVHDHDSATKPFTYGGWGYNNSRYPKAPTKACEELIKTTLFLKTDISFSCGLTRYELTELGKSLTLQQISEYDTETQ